MAQYPCTSSGLKSADAAIVSGPGKLRHVMVLADGTNAATVILYDSGAASGTVVAKIIVDAGATFEHVTFDDGVVFNTGLYLDIGGTGAECVIGYEQG